MAVSFGLGLLCDNLHRSSVRHDQAACNMTRVTAGSV
jgi:hypothetical protein